MDLKRRLKNIRKISALTRMLGLKQTAKFAFHRYAHKETIVKLGLEGIPSPVFLRSKGPDINCLWQVFGTRSCHLELTPPPEVIIDGGAHVGLASVSFANQYPNARILAIEPESSNFALARMNLRCYPNIQIRQCALWSRDTPLVIENPRGQSWSFRVQEPTRPASGAYLGRSIDSLIRELAIGPVDLLKLDIEGAEVQVFCSEELEWLDKVRALIIETHGREAQSLVEIVMKKRRFRRDCQGEKQIYLR